MTTKNKQPMEIGEPNTEAVLEQTTPQIIGDEGTTGIPPNSNGKDEAQMTRINQEEKAESVIQQEPSGENSLDTGAVAERDSTIPISELEDAQDRMSEDKGISHTDTEKTDDLNPVHEEESIMLEVGETKDENVANDTVEITKKKRSIFRKRKTETEETEGDLPEKKSRKKSKTDSEILTSKEDDQARMAVTAKKLKLPKPVRQVVSIDDERSVQTDEDRAKDDLLDLIESLKTKKILSGTIQGVERTAGEPLAVVYHGAFKVILPALEVVDAPSDYRGVNKNDVHQFLLNKRLGSEIDYVITGIDPEYNLAIASRKDAMRTKRKEYYFSTDREGNNLLYSGICAEARVVSVIRAGIFVDLFGVEVYIPLRELSYQRMLDAANNFQNGQRILVKILEIDKRDKDNVRVKASVKQAGKNPYEQALRRYIVGNRYVGTVSMVDTSGVFVALDGGIDCLCSHPKRGRPPRGARVTVRVLGINNETNRIWGAITHTANPR